ncbi:MAG: autotransporter domain-containing protein [Burkholderiaceae bacterium]|nr:autotransporter domain-containing protein [Burkholderiaceae bacterium]
MNHSYKSIFNRRLGIWQVVSELARGAGKTSGAICKPLAAMTLGMFVGTAMANTIIDGGQTVTVPGDHASPWTENLLFVGSVTDGTLNIIPGGIVTNIVGLIGANDASGTVNVKGATATWNTTSSLYVGEGGNGELNIENGGRVNTSLIYVGLTSVGTGKINVTGTDSRLDVSSNIFEIGSSGNGTVTIDNGGTVRGNNILLTQDNSGSGTLNLNATGGVRGVLETGYVEKGDGTARINWNGGILRATANESNFLRNLTSTDVIIGSGGAYFDTNTYNVGLNAASLGGSGDFTKLGTGTLTLNGNSSGVLSQIGVEEGTLAIAGDISSASGRIDYTGSDINQSATVKVEGNGNKWTNSGLLDVGYSGTGTLTIANGGKVENTIGRIATLAGSSGTVSVSGTGSTWNNSNYLTVGNHGTGELTIANGGTVTSTWGDIGSGPSANGTVTVSDINSKWTASRSLSIGYDGTGELTIENGGIVHSSQYTQLTNSLSGNASIQLNGSSAARGVLETAYVTKGAGTVAFNWNGGILRATGNETNFLRNLASSDIVIGSAGAYFDTNTYNVGINTILNGSGGLSKLGLGTLTLTAANTYGGDTEINAGILRIANTGSLAGAVNVNNGGTLAGSGMVKNTTVMDGGTVHSDADILTIDGNYTQNTNATLRIDATSSSNYSKLHVTGNASFAAGTRLDVNVNPINTLALDNILTDVVKANTGLTSSDFRVTDNSALFNFRAIGNANSIDLRVVSNSATGIRDAVIERRHWASLGAADVLDTQLNNSVRGDMGNVINAFGQLSTNRDVARAATQTLPLVSGNQAILNTLTSFQRLLQNRSGTASGVSSGDALPSKEAWARAFGSRAEQDDRNGTSGFTADSWGMAFGADAQIAADARFGVAYGYAKTSVNGNTELAGTAQRVNIDSHILSAYGSKDIGDARNISWQADVGMNNNKSTRQMEFGGLNRSATADYRTYSAHLGAAITQQIALSSATTLTPGLRADYSWLKSQSYSETGANALNLNVDAQKTDAFVLGADAHLQHRYSAVSRLDANFGVGYDTINKRGNIVAAYAGAPGQAFVTSGIDHSPWLLRGGIGFVHTTMNGTEIALRYDAEGRSDYLNQTASVRAKWAF